MEKTLSETLSRYELWASSSLGTPKSVKCFYTDTGNKYLLFAADLLHELHNQHPLAQYVEHVVHEFSKTHGSAHADRLLYFICRFTRAAKHLSNMGIPVTNVIKEMRSSLQQIKSNVSQHASTLDQVVATLKDTSSNTMKHCGPDITSSGDTGVHAGKVSVDSIEPTENVKDQVSSSILQKKDLDTYKQYLYENLKAKFPKGKEANMVTHSASDSEIKAAIVQDSVSTEQAEISSDSPTRKASFNVDSIDEHEQDSAVSPTKQASFNVDKFDADILEKHKQAEISDVTLTKQASFNVDNFDEHDVVQAEISAVSPTKQASFNVDYFDENKQAEISAVSQTKQASFNVDSPEEHEQDELSADVGITRQASFNVDSPEEHEKLTLQSRKPSSSVIGTSDNFMETDIDTSLQVKSTQIYLSGENTDNLNQQYQISTDTKNVETIQNSVTNNESGCFFSRDGTSSLIDGLAAECRMPHEDEQDTGNLCDQDTDNNTGIQEKEKPDITIELEKLHENIQADIKDSKFMSAAIQNRQRSAKLPSEGIDDEFDDCFDVPTSNTRSSSSHKNTQSVMETITHVTTESSKLGFEDIGFTVIETDGKNGVMPKVVNVAQYDSVVDNYDVTDNELGLPNMDTKTRDAVNVGTVLYIPGLDQCRTNKENTSPHVPCVEKRRQSMECPSVNTNVSDNLGSGITYSKHEATAGVNGHKSCSKSNKQLQCVNSTLCRHSTSDKDLNNACNADTASATSTTEAKKGKCCGEISKQLPATSNSLPNNDTGRQNQHMKQVKATNTSVNPEIFGVATSLKQPRNVCTGLNILPANSKDSLASIQQTLQSYVKGKSGKATQAVTSRSGIFTRSRHMNTESNDSSIQLVQSQKRSTHTLPCRKHNDVRLSINITKHLCVSNNSIPKSEAVPEAHDSKELEETVAKLVHHVVHCDDETVLTAIAKVVSNQCPNTDKLRLKTDLVQCYHVYGKSRCPTIIKGLVFQTSQDNIEKVQQIHDQPCKVLCVNGDLSWLYTHTGYKGLKHTQVATTDHLTSGINWINVVVDILNKLSVDIVLVKGTVPDKVYCECGTEGIIVMSSVPYRVLEKICEVTHTQMVTYLSLATQDNVCEDAYISPWNSDWLDKDYSKHEVVLRLSAATTQTVVLSELIPSIAELKEQKFWSGLHQMSVLLSSREIITGACKSELLCAKFLERLRETLLRSKPSVKATSHYQQLVTSVLESCFHDYVAIVRRASDFYESLDVKQDIWNLALNTTAVLMNTDQFILTGIIEAKSRDQF